MALERLIDGQMPLDDMVRFFEVSVKRMLDFECRQEDIDAALLNARECLALKKFPNSN